MKYLTKRRVRAWLTAKVPSHYVGRARLASRCPLSRHLADINGIDLAHSLGNRPWVNPDFYDIPRPDGTHVRGRTPPWAARYIHALDARHAGPVTAKQALDLLDELCPLPKEHHP